MSRIEMLRVLVNERLAAAAEEIFGVFERTIDDYVEEIDRRHRLMDVLQPETKITLYPRDHIQLLVCEEEVPPEQRGSLSLGQEDPEPPQIKEEHEELWTSQGGEQHQELKEAYIMKLPFTPIPVKEENDEEKPQTSQLNQTQTEEGGVGVPLPGTSTEQMKTEPDGEDCGVSESASNSDLAVDTEPTPDGQLLPSDCSKSETEDRDAWKETRETQPGSNRWRSKRTQRVKGQSSSISSNKFKIPLESSPELQLSNPTQASHCCKVCRNSFPNKRSLMAHVTGKFHPHNCGLCGKHLESTESLKLHFNTHRKCKVCGKRFTCFTDLERHERIHTGERPFSCTVCGRGFRQTQHVQIHMRIHTGEKPFSCTVCGARFSRSETLQSHMGIHTGERTLRKGCVQNETLQSCMRIHTGKTPFNCTVCGKAFDQHQHLQNHMRIHTEEKPISCTVCGKRFNQKRTLTIHMRIHTGAKPYSCGVCGEKFRHCSGLNKHRCLSGV